MKNKKNNIITIAVSAFSACAIMAAAFSIKGAIHLKASADTFCNHEGHHYAELAPTASTTGHREFWTCCKCSKQFLAKPRTGTFTDHAEGEMVGEVTSSHIAYLGTVSVWDGTNTSAPGNGSGTEADPYLIESAAELRYYALKFNQVDSTTHQHSNQLYLKHYKLMTDIDLDNRAWTQMGNSKYATFQGVFDGNGHNIINLNRSAGVCYGGLFGYVADAEIRNLNVSGTVTGASNSWMDGLLVGVMEKSIIENCQTFGSITSGTNSTGGIVGKVNDPNPSEEIVVISNHTESKILNCTNYASVNLTAPTTYPNGSAGGIVGELANTENITIKDCINYGTVSGGNACGGILGKGLETSHTVLIQNCINVGNISGVGITGGLVGIFRKAANASIVSCENYGDVTDSTNKAGGLVGILRCTVSNCMVGSDVKVCGTIVSAGTPTGVHAAFIYQIDSANGGAASGNSIVDPKY